MSAFEYDHDDAPVELARWLPWPQCPICARRRHARCPTCGFASDDFALADYQERGLHAQPSLSDGEPAAADLELDEVVLLMCSQCEEAFRPRFYDRCAACGYEFGDGVRLEPAESEELSTRALWAATALVALLTALCLYFGAILRP